MYVSVKQTDLLTPEQEDVLWNKNFLRPQFSKSYINTVFDYNCKLFGLRGLDEHRKVEVCQLRVIYSTAKLILNFVGAHQKILLGDFTRGTFLQKRSATSLNRERHEVCTIYMHLTSLWLNKIHSIDGYFQDHKFALEFNLWGGGAISWGPLSRQCVLRQDLLETFQTTQGNALAQRPCFSPVSCMIKVNKSIKIIYVL